MEENKFVSIDEMKERLENFGSKRIWETIEMIGDWKDRTMYRQLFFLAGGSLEENK